MIFINRSIYKSTGKLVAESREGWIKPVWPHWKDGRPDIFTYWYEFMAYGGRIGAILPQGQELCLNQQSGRTDVTSAVTPDGSSVSMKWSILFRETAPVTIMWLLLHFVGGQSYHVLICLSSLFMEFMMTSGFGQCLLWRDLEHDAVKVNNKLL